MPDDARPLGEPVEFAGARVPARGTTLSGATVVLRPIDPDGDVNPLYAVSHPQDGDPAVWTYLFEGPFPSPIEMHGNLETAAGATDRVFFAIVPAADGVAQGICSYLRIEPAQGCIEIGNIWFAPSLQRTKAATEAIFLLARHAFDELGYRRLEWKCNALNAPSRRAAVRFGFRFEGVFEQHMIVKGRNRDTAWFAITDQRWPAIRTAFDTWLSPANFDTGGIQLRSLGALTAGI